MPRFPFEAASALKHVAYVDRGLVLLNKPPGLVCQPNQVKLGSAGRTGHIRNDFGYFLQEIRTGLNLDNDLFPIHRLDKCTTGSLILARSLNMARELSRQFNRRSVTKVYLALVQGGATSFPAKSGIIKAKIRYTEGRGSLESSSEVDSNSMTSWQVLASSPLVPLSLVRLTLHTGLKHQLRIHMAQYLKAPILGDTLYSGTDASKQINDIRVPRDRVFLHSSLIGVDRFRKTGPIKRFRLGLRAPLPSDFMNLCSDILIHPDPDEAQGGMYIDGRRTEGSFISDLNGRWLQ